MTPRLEIYQDRKREWRFRYRAGNARIVFWSEGYKTMWGAHNAAVKVRATFVVDLVDITIKDGKRR